MSTSRFVATVITIILVISYFTIITNRILINLKEKAAQRAAIEKDKNIALHKAAKMAADKKDKGYKNTKIKT